ncbi:hypothetical protein [Mycobacterium asiaticum]|uniref:hypothetical protein n=1 Tax=Mycobacterium asiaticum TaxID=1790 RepID=UPI0012DB5557|nr:hypothetical protein [Mycobacterium asiaticum]
MTEVERTTLLLGQLSLVVAAVSAVLALLTLWFVWIAELRFRRRFGPVVWWLEHLRTSEDDTGELNIHHYWLMNLGSESATNLSVESTSALQSTGASVRVLKSGENHEMSVLSNDYDNDWFLVGWADASDHRYFRFQWFPMNSTGPLGEIWQEQREAAVWRSRWQRLLPKRLKTKQVGPGAGVFTSAIRTGQRQKSAEQFRKARGLFDAAREQKIPGLRRKKSVRR